MLQIFGGIVGMYFLSGIFRITVFRKQSDFLLRNIYSILLFYPIAGVISAYGSADGGDPNFMYGFISYGISATLLMIIIWLVKLFKIENSLIWIMAILLFVPTIIVTVFIILSG